MSPLMGHDPNVGIKKNINKKERSMSLMDSSKMGDRLIEVSMGDCDSNSVSSSDDSVCDSRKNSAGGNM